MLYQRQLEEHIILEAIEFADQHGVTLTGEDMFFLSPLVQHPLLVYLQRHTCVIAPLLPAVLHPAEALTPAAHHNQDSLLDLTTPNFDHHHPAAYCGDRIVCRETDEQSDRLLFYKEPPPESVGEPAHILGFYSIVCTIDRSLGAAVLQGAAARVRG